jgi:hypothetical protein
MTARGGSSRSSRRAAADSAAAAAGVQDPGVRQGEKRTPRLASRGSRLYQSRQGIDTEGNITTPLWTGWIPVGSVNGFAP